jgi:hypothetical protein
VTLLPRAGVVQEEANVTVCAAVRRRPSRHCSINYNHLSDIITTLKISPILQYTVSRGKRKS